VRVKERKKERKEEKKKKSKKRRKKRKKSKKRRKNECVVHHTVMLKASAQETGQAIEKDMNALQLSRALPLKKVTGVGYVTEPL